MHNVPFRRFKVVGKLRQRALVRVEGCEEKLKKEDPVQTMPVRNYAGINLTQFASILTMPVRCRFWVLFCFRI